MTTVEGMNPWIYGPFLIVGYKGFFPAGRIRDPVTKETISHRKKSLVQLWVDPGGMRTLAVADIRLKDPSRTS